MQIPIGYFADRFNLRWLYAGAFALWSLAQGLTGFAGGLTAFVLFRILLGIGESIYLPGGTKIVNRLFSAKDRGFSSALFYMGTRTGLVLDGLLIPWLLVHYGWRRMFFIVGFSAILWLIPWIMIYPATPYKTRSRWASSSLRATHSLIAHFRVINRAIPHQLLLLTM
jgi:MFS family permease